MLYRILRAITSIGLLGYYRKIYLHLDQPIPKDRPVILAANHPNAFTEPLLLTCFLDRILHFITRSDVFHPMLMWFFKGTHQIPIYRFVDKGGFKNLKNNQETFAKCYDVLSKNGAILIFSEGSTRLGKTVRPLQKGTARMGFGLVDAYPDADPVIIPVGFTYTRPNHWNGDVIINGGTQIEVKDFINPDRHINDSIKAINGEIKKQLDVLAINIENAEDQEFQEGIAHLNRRAKDSSIRTVLDKKEFFNQEYVWTDQVNNQEFGGKKSAWVKYKSVLSKNKISTLDYSPDNMTGSKYLFLIVMLPIAALGLLICLIPFLLTSWIAKNKVKPLIFNSGVKIGMATFVSFILSLIVMSICIAKFGWWGLFASPAIILSMSIGVKWLSLFQELRAHVKYSMLNKSIKDQILDLSKNLKT